MREGEVYKKKAVYRERERHKYQDIEKNIERKESEQ